MLALSGREGSALENTGLLVATIFVCWTVVIFKSLDLQSLQNFKLYPVGLLCCGSKRAKGKDRVIRKRMPRTGKTRRQNMS